MAELLPCPFCGKQPERLDSRFWTGMRNDIIRVEYRCHCDGHTARQRGLIQISGVTDAEAVEAWNRRAPVAVQEEGDARPLMRMRGYHALVQVIYELQQDGQYSDEEGEETAALAELLAAIEKGGALNQRAGFLTATNKD